jgi:HlyD family secretion protein
MTSPQPPNAQRSIRRHLIVGTMLVGLLAGGVGGWASTAELSGAVIAPGLLVVDTSVKKVQHPTGGVVGELRVREGDAVKAGDVVVRLDDTVTRANLAIVTKSLDELEARRARNEAERDGAERVAFPQELLERVGDPAVASLVHGEQRLFELRRSARAGQKSQLKERTAQLREQIDGLTKQVAAKSREIELITQELEGVRDLWRKNLVQISRVTALERDAARIEGERGQLIAATAEVKGKIVETELQILQIDQDLRTEVGKELADIRGKTSELVERKVSAEDQLKRIDIRAPQDGIVHQLTVHTVGGVVTPNGEPIMLIVPKADALRVEAKIQPQDIDQVHLGQRALLRFSAFNQRTTPEIDGEVTLVSADISTDQKTGANYYTVRISLSDHELSRLEGLRLVPGMPVESFIQTSPRTVISYLVRPLHDQITRAFREK